MSSVRRILYPGRQYLLRDEFNDDRVAGALHGVTLPATPGPGMRTGVVDTASKLSITGGVLRFAGGVVFGDPKVPYTSLTRQAGLACKTTTQYATAGLVDAAQFCLDDGSVYGIRVQSSSVGNAIRLNDTHIGGLNSNFDTTVTNTTYKLLIVLRTVGAYWFWNDGTWKLLWISGLGNGATVTPYIRAVLATDIVSTWDYIHVLSRLWLPPVLAHDTFTRANGAIGSTEPAGPDNQGAPILAWTGATWTIATNKAINTPVAGVDVIVNGTFDTDANWTKGTGWTIDTANSNVAEKAAGTASTLAAIVAPLTTGGWYKYTFDIVSITAGTFYASLGAATGPSRSVVGTYSISARALSTSVGLYASALANGTVDNVIVQPLTLSALLASLQDVGTPNVVIDATLAAYTNGWQMGIVARLDSAASPANFVKAVQNGDYVEINECVAGVYTNLATVVSAFAASDVLRLDLSGANYRLYKITSAGVATLLSASTTNVTASGLSGLFSTLPANTFSKFTVMQKAGYSPPAE